MGTTGGRTVRPARRHVHLRRHPIRRRCRRIRRRDGHWRRNREDQLLRRAHPRVERTLADLAGIFRFPETENSSVSFNSLLQK